MGKMLGEGLTGATTTHRNDNRRNDNQLKDFDYNINYQHNATTRLRAQKLTWERLKVVWAEFSTLGLAVFVM
jgi:hypothetical protein